MKIAFYAGSFDPFTYGHLNVIKTAARIFDKIIIGIGNNALKKRRFSAEIMKNAIQQTLKANNLSNCEVIVYDGLTADCALLYGAQFLIRGLRNGVDYHYEENLAIVNSQVSNLETLYLRAGELGYISSSMVMELLQHGKDVAPYVPSEVLKVIKQ